MKRSTCSSWSSVRPAPSWASWTKSGTSPIWCWTLGWRRPRPGAPRHSTRWAGGSARRKANTATPKRSTTPCSAKNSKRRSPRDPGRMTALRDFVADLMERRGAAVEPLEPHGLAVMAPPEVRAALGWPELARLGFGADLPAGAERVGVEGGWLERFGALIADRGRYGARQLDCDPRPTLSDPGRLLDRVLDLPNATWRFRSQRPAWARLILTAFRMTAVSDEKRENNL